MKGDTPALFYLRSGTELIPPPVVAPPVRHALDMLARDMARVLGPAAPAAGRENGRIVVEYAGNDSPLADRPEAFAITFAPGPDGSLEMRVTGRDDLGIVYGLLHVSRIHLGVEPFWFWADRRPRRRAAVAIPARDYVSPPSKVRFRGWFVNDEVCLIGWAGSYPPPREVWQPVFEALLRCGGNMVIPGTDLPRNGVHWDLAAEMGLWLTHHHAEPLGAEMFLRAHPELEPSYDRHDALFEQLWEEAIVRNRERKTIWVLGFRGQGDAPFWENDPARATPAARAALINRVIERQYEMVRGHVRDPICGTYLYGEIAELYRSGLLEFPDGVIKIWADNGYGKMVSRRQGNHNPRLPSLPAKGDPGPHGLYYHVTFHDLQASSHLTMLGNPPRFVAGELAEALAAGADRFIMVNCGNIRPHLYILDAVREFWEGGELNAVRHSADFGRRYFPSAPEQVMDCYEGYFAAAIDYGPHPDDRAGEEFYHHPARAMAVHWLRGGEDPEESLFWATGQAPFAAQVEWFRSRCAKSLGAWEELHQRCLGALESLSRRDAVFFRDNLLLQVILHLTGCRGMLALCRALLAGCRGDYPSAFLMATEAMRHYGAGRQVLSRAEHGYWRNFYRADWLTNIGCTIYCLDTLRRHLRALGDGPHFFAWYKQFVIPAAERRIYLENTQRRTLDDDELADLMLREFRNP